MPLQPGRNHPRVPPLCHPATLIFAEGYFVMMVLSMRRRRRKWRQCWVTQRDLLNLFTVEVIPTSGTFYFPVNIMHFSMCSSALKSIPTLLLHKFPKIFPFVDIQPAPFNHKKMGRMLFPFQTSSPRELADWKQMFENRWMSQTDCAS